MSKQTYNKFQITYLRISLTEACNFRCLYCKARGEDFLKIEKSLSVEEITTLVKVLSKYGLKTVRFTGGEPLLRKDIEQIVKNTSRWVEDIGLTTNGFLLDKYAQSLRKAGLKRLNVSVDTLDPKKFQQLTGGDLFKVLKGLEIAKRVGFKTIKINTVAIKGFTTSKDIDELLEYSARNSFHLRFIELMPVGELPFFREDRFLPLSEVQNYIEEKYGKLIPLEREGSKASKDFYLPSLGIKVGFIKSITEPFCEGCSKLRLTPDGKIHFCLRTDQEVDIRKYLKDPQRLEEFIPTLLKLKRESNEFISRNGFGWFIKEKTMVKIGG
jgi:cyclic pyranopterin phosphate synthase